MGVGAGGNVRLGSEGTSNLTTFLAVAGSPLEKREPRLGCLSGQIHMKRSTVIHAQTNSHKRLGHLMILGLMSQPQAPQ